MVSDQPSGKHRCTLQIYICKNSQISSKCPSLAMRPCKTGERGSPARQGPSLAGRPCKTGERGSPALQGPSLAGRPCKTGEQGSPALQGRYIYMYPPSLPGFRARPRVVLAQPAPRAYSRPFLEPLLDANKTRPDCFQVYIDPGF